MQQEVVIRRSPVKIVESIYEYMEKNKNTVLSPTRISRETGLNYDSCKQYLDLIALIQNRDRINSFKTPKGELYVIGGLASLPAEQQSTVLKKGFEMNLTESDKLYIGLLENGVTSNKKAMALPKSKVVKEGLKFKHLAEANGRIYLTEIGQYIAKGAKKIFNQ